MVDQHNYHLPAVDTINNALHCVHRKNRFMFSKAPVFQPVTKAPLTGEPLAVVSALLRFQHPRDVIWWVAKGVRYSLVPTSSCHVMITIYRCHPAVPIRVRRKCQGPPANSWLLYLQNGFHDGIGCSWVGLPMGKKSPKLRSVSETFLQKSERESVKVAEIEILARINSAGKWLTDSIFYFHAGKYAHIYKH